MLSSYTERDIRRLILVPRRKTIGTRSSEEWTFSPDSVGKQKQFRNTYRLSMEKKRKNRRRKARKRADQKDNPLATESNSEMTLG